MEYNDGREYDKIHQNYYYKIWHQILELYLEKLIPQKGNILDAGGGTAELSIKIAKMNSLLKITNCDISKSMLKQAKFKIEKQNLQSQISNIYGDLMKLPFSDDSFDFTLCMGDALSFCSNIELAFNELVRVTKKKGLILISVNTFWGNFHNFLSQGDSMNISFEDILNYYKTRIIHQNNKNTKCKSFTVEELKKLAQTNKLQIRKIFSVPVFPINKSWLDNKEKKDFLMNLQLKHCEDDNLIEFGNHINVVYEK